ncbi:MAG: transcriptional repressor LexA [Verrucomicrobiota bacterium]
MNSMLTGRQQQLLDFIRDQQQTTGFTPSTREIQGHFGFGSQTAVMDHLRAMERKGVLERQPGKARSILLAETVQRGSIIDIPLYGMIPAGVPSDQQQETDGCISIDLETIRLPKGSKVFALKVCGDSMVNAGIHEHDTIILELKEPRERDVVAALIDGETTLKRYIVQQGKPYLRAENPKYPDLIPACELVIQGVMIALLRLVN